MLRSTLCPEKKWAPEDFATLYKPSRN